MKASVDRFSWEYAGDGPEGKPLFIDGSDIWKLEWMSTGEKITRNDPLYHNEHTYHVNKATDESGREIKFAVCEYSNCYYGFYEYVDRLNIGERYSRMKKTEK